MRFPRISRTVRHSQVAATYSALILLVSGLVGCEGLTPQSFDPNKGFIDPTELAVTVPANKGTLLVPILDKLNTNIDETTDDVENATDITADDMVAHPSDYTIGASDLINVTINDLQALGAETVKQARVSESGNISLPLIGQVQAVGYTEAQLEQIIAAKYQDAGFLKNATVSVEVVEARARTFSILGAIGAPGQYAIPKSDFRILDALVLAHDLTVDTDIRGSRGVEYIYVLRSATVPGSTTAAPTSAPTTNPTDILAPKPAASEAPALAPADVNATAAATTAPATAAASDNESRYVIIDGKPVLVQGPAPATSQPAEAPTTQGFAFNDLKEPSDKRLIRIPIGALKQGELRYNIVVRPDDLVIVKAPVQGEYYMGGHVARVGVYSLTARKIDLIEAIVSAGMLDQLAVPGRTLIRRRVEDNKQVVARVDLEKIFAGEEPNIYLKPDDVVEVGTNAVAPFIAAARSGYRITYGFGFLYDRNYAPQNSQGG